MNNNPLLSICIPCFGRVEYVRNTLNSIFQGNADVSLDKYEVVISDNDPKQAISVLANEFKAYPNLRYFHTECEGLLPMIQPYLYHDFHVEEGTGAVLLGEVSMCNDDENDNRFYEPIGRFPTIEEDEPAYRLLCNEYPAAAE